MRKTLLLDNPLLQLLLALGACLFVFFLQTRLPPLLVLGVTLTPLLIIISFRKPDVAAILFVSFSFFRLHEAYPLIEPLHPILVTSVLALVVLVWHAFLARTITPVWSTSLTLLMIFFLLTTIDIPFAFETPLASQYWSGNYVKIIIMVPAIAWLIRTANDFSWANRIIVGSGTLIAIRAIYNKIHGIGLVEGTRVTIGRPTIVSPFNPDDPSAPPLDHLLDLAQTRAVLSDPNDLALILLFPLCFAAALFAYRTGFFNRLLGLVGASTIMLGIIATQSRGGLLGVLAVLGVIGLKTIRSKALLAALGAMAFVALVLAMGLANRSSGGYAELSKNGGIDDSSMGRIIAWGAAINMAASRPLFGVGLNNFETAFRSYAPIWPGMNKAVHSTWFGVLAETGLPGIVVFLSMVFVTIRTALFDFNRLHDSDVPIEIKATSLALLAGLASFCTAGTFLTQGFTWPIYILMALTISVSQFSKNHFSPPPGKEKTFS